MNKNSFTPIDVLILTAAVVASESQACFRATQPGEDTPGAEAPAVHRANFHPYFERALAPQAPGADQTVRLDGKSIPSRFILHIGGEDIPEAEPMEFVLVKPQDVVVDGLTFSVSRPFYVATTELSNAQHAALFWGAESSYESYEAFAAHQYHAAKVSLDTPDAALAGIRKHVENPAMPALALGPGEAAARAARLSSITRMDVRLPTIAQWFSAMRVGSGERFWWGESMPESPLVWRTGTARQEVAFDYVQAVDAGVPNPAGLRHVIGNAGELAFPSERERELLRTRYGPWAPNSSIARHREVGFTVRPYSAVVLGGAATTGSVLEEAEAWDAFVRSTTQWNELLLWSQIEINPGWCFHRNWCTGVRFVIELPDGEITYAGEQLVPTGGPE